MQCPPPIVEIARVTPATFRAATQFVDKFGGAAIYNWPEDILESMMQEDRLRAMYLVLPNGRRRLIAIGGYDLVTVNVGRFGRDDRGTMVLAVLRHVLVHPDYRRLGAGPTLAGHIFGESIVRGRGKIEGVVAATIDPTRVVSEAMTKSLLGSGEFSWELDVTPGMRDFVSQMFEVAGDKSPELRILIFNHRRLHLVARSCVAMMLDVLKSDRLWVVSTVLPGLDAEAKRDLEGLALLNRSTLIKYHLVRERAPKGVGQAERTLFGRYSNLLRSAKILAFPKPSTLPAIAIDDITAA